MISYDGRNRHAINLLKTIYFDPGGWADVGEYPSEMVVREVWEESGFRVEARKVIGERLEGGFVMSTIDPRVEEGLRQGLKYFNHRFMLPMWRLGLGPWVNAWPEVGGQIMVITHTGRKTGIRRRTPVNYAIVDGDIYCTAGFGPTSDWYRNIMANPEVEVWLPDGWWAGVAEDISDSEARLPLLRQVLIGSGFAARLAGINPITMTDEELDAATAHYPLIHIRRTEARTGPGGPGDLAWVWPLATMILLSFVLFRRKGQG